jgi:hypothetical protein
MIKENKYKKNRPMTIKKLLKIPIRLESYKGEYYLLIKGTIALNKPAIIPCISLTMKKTEKLGQRLNSVRSKATKLKNNI